jgi:hypothetical protein
LDLGTQFDILLARVMLSPPKKDARAEQYHQGSFEQHGFEPPAIAGSKFTPNRSRCSPCRCRLFVKLAGVSMSYNNP